MSRRDPLRILEATYRFDLPEGEWLGELANALAPYAFSRGVMVYTTDLGEDLAVRNARAANMSFDVSDVRKMLGSMPPAFFRRLHAPFPTSFSAEAWPKFAEEVGGIDLRSAVETTYSVAAERAPHGWAISGGDAGREGVIAVFHCEADDVIAPRDRHVLDLLAAHFSSVLRLRSVLGQPTTNHDEVDLVLSPDGKLLHANASVADDPIKDSLIHAVRTSERARLRQASSEERLELWTALVEGRWSILESVESDGKRTLLLCRNQPRIAAIRALTERERSVAQYIALGHSFKYIAYELGIALQTASADLDIALRKLGLQNRADLIKLFSA